jgi:Family of unknown function (DUF6065)
LLHFHHEWQFTRPGLVVFEKDEPFCFITLVEYRALDDVTPEIVPLKENPELAAPFNAYRDARKNFIAALDEKDPAAVKQGGKNGTCGEKTPFRAERNPAHASKLSVAAPVERPKTCPRGMAKTTEETGSE